MLRICLCALLLLILRLPGIAAELERWIYCSQNLWVDKNVDELEVILRRAAKAGYTHVLIADSKFAKLGDMDARYFRNIERVKALGKELKLEIVPAVFPVGYSNDLLWHDPNLAEALPVMETPLLVSNGVASVLQKPSLLPGGDFEDFRAWSWKDETVILTNGTAMIENPDGRNARIVRKIQLTPFRQYHIAVRIKTEDFRGTPEIKVIGKSGVLNYDYAGVKPKQDWQSHHAVFNSLSNTEASVYFGCWDGQQGKLWFDDALLEEVALLNVVRRPGAPLEIKTEGSRELEEGKDYEPVKDPRMGNQPWPGAYEVWHEPPTVRTKLPDGTRLRASYYHVATVHDGQAMVCVSEPRTLELLEDQAKRMHAAWQAKSYFMSHDEIRVFNWCAACQKRKLDAGALLADNARSCTRILKTVNPGGKIYVWSDMFDPHHNAHENYYLVRGNLAGSWEGLSSDVIVVPWYFQKRKESLKWFSERGHSQVIAGYYDADPGKVRQWLEAAKDVPGVRGVMYTTWQRKYADLEVFSRHISEAVK